jgi:ABC-type multidrug transport system fused ATPase/permease subunit
MKNFSSDKEVLEFSWWKMLKALHYLLDNKRRVYYLYTSVLILVLFYNLVPTFILGKIIDFFTKYKAGDPLETFYFYIIVLTVSWGIIALIRLSLKKRLQIVQSDVTYFTRVKGFERLLDYSVSWHDKENTGNKVQRIQAGTDALKIIQGILSDGVFTQMTGIFGVLVMLLFVKPIFSLYCLIYISIFALIQYSFYHRMVEMNNINNKLQEKAGGAYYEGLGNILTIKTLGVKDDFKQSVISKETSTRDYSIKRTTMMNNKWKSFQVINALSIGGILYLAGQNFVAGSISLGSIFIVYNYFQSLNGNVSGSTDSIERLTTAKVSIARMMSIFWGEKEFEQGHLDFPKDWNNIRLENAAFKYPQTSENGTKDSGLRNLSISIKKYEKVGVVGKSGSGKSTFAKMMLGLYRFSEGKFLIGNDNFYDIKHDSITKDIALVLQDSEMFNLSFKENITLMRKFDEELFERAINISQLKDVIEKLPEGVETLIGEKGYRLSGGERQRIGIARAIYKDPQILVLDEATSSLDSKTESLIQQAFEENLAKKTVISIAHRVSTLKNVDKIVVFENGEVVEEGRFDELSGDHQSKFFEIYEQQHRAIGEEKVG